MGNIILSQIPFDRETISNASRAEAYPLTEEFLNKGKINKKDTIIIMADEISAAKKLRNLIPKHRVLFRLRASYNFQETNPERYAYAGTPEEISKLFGINYKSNHDDQGLHYVFITEWHKPPSWRS